MNAVISLIREKTILEMDSGWGVPIGVLLLIAVVIQLLRNNSRNLFSESSKSSTNDDAAEMFFKRYEAEAARRRSLRIGPAKPKSKSSAEIAREVGGKLVAIINATAERTGLSHRHIGSLIQSETGVPFTMEAGKLNITEQQLVRLAPHLEKIIEHCALLPDRSEIGDANLNTSGL